MSRENEIITLLNNISAKVDVIFDSLPQEKKAEITEKLLRQEFEKVTCTAAINPKKFQDFLKAHPREAIKFCRDASN